MVTHRFPFPSCNINPQFHYLHGFQLHSQDMSTRASAVVWEGTLSRGVGIAQFTATTAWPVRGQMPLLPSCSRGCHGPRESQDEDTGRALKDPAPVHRLSPTSDRPSPCPPPSNHAGSSQEEWMAAAFHPHLKSVPFKDTAETRTRCHEGSLVCCGSCSGAGASRCYLLRERHFTAGRSTGTWHLDAAPSRNLAS